MENKMLNMTLRFTKALSGLGFLCPLVTSVIGGFFMSEWRKSSRCRVGIPTVRAGRGDDLLCNCAKALRANAGANPVSLFLCRVIMTGQRRLYLAVRFSILGLKGV